MKKLALVCLLAFAIAGSAAALPNYVWNVGGYDENGMNGAYTFFGQQTSGVGTTNLSVGATSAAVASLGYTGGVDSTMVKNGLFAKNFVNPGQGRYILQAWAGVDFAGSELSVRVWASTATATIPGAGWKLYKLYDPISNTWGKTELSTSSIMATSNGSSASPWFKVALPVYKTGTPLAANNGYILSLEVPEPGSMVAMLSGLVGLVGFGIRRRK